MNEKTRFRDQVRCTLIFLSLQYVQASVIPVVESLLCLFTLRGGDGTLGAPTLSDRLAAALMLLKAALGYLYNQICSTGDGRRMWSSFFHSTLLDAGEMRVGNSQGRKMYDRSRDS
jgi:hypothetical protein